MPDLSLFDLPPQRPAPAWEVGNPVTVFGGSGIGQSGVVAHVDDDGPFPVYVVNVHTAKGTVQLRCSALALRS